MSIYSQDMNHTILRKHLKALHILFSIHIDPCTVKRPLYGKLLSPYGVNKTGYVVHILVNEIVSA